MKAWIAEHKFYAVAGALLLFGGLYYWLIYQPQAASEQKITGIETSAAKENDKNSTADPKENKQTDQMKQQVNKNETVLVDVKGEIKQPGVYQASQNERVIDVISKAGGLTENADQSQVNFAAHVQDEMVIYIPAKGEASVDSPAAGSVSTAAKTGSGAAAGKININKADESELQNLPGIGPAKAAAIIQFRQEHGPFATIEDLKKISGIGDKTFEKLKDSISVQ